MPTKHQRKERLYRLFTRISGAMANPHRLELLDLLVQAPRTVEELAREANLAVANASQHLQRLKQARLVVAEREGLYQRYRLTDPAVMRLWLELRAVGEQQIDEIDQALDAYRTRRHEFGKVTIDTEGLMRHNPIWNLTRFGWAYSSWVQPVERKLNPIVRDVQEKGFWAQVSIRYAVLCSKPNDQAALLYRLYYSSVHLVIARIEDESGQSWYQLRDDQYSTALQYVRAAGLRIIPPGEMTPLSPAVEDKRIEVDTQQQMVYAYENGELVFSTQCATGAAFNVDGLGIVDFTTPRGEFSVIRKRPRRHLIGFQERSDGYDLPGVPSPTYFTASGVAIHGAYWHNDFGRARSHGCVNVRPEAAQWFYRWTSIRPMPRFLTARPRSN